MDERILLIGFDAPEAAALSERLPHECVSHEMLPRIVVERGQLFVQSPRSAQFLQVSRVVFHGIFEHDLDFLAGLALWGGPCFPDRRRPSRAALLSRCPRCSRAGRFSRRTGEPARFAADRRGFAEIGRDDFDRSPRLATEAIRRRIKAISAARDEDQVVAATRQSVGLDGPDAGRGAGNHRLAQAPGRLVLGSGCHFAISSGAAGSGGTGNAMSVAIFHPSGVRFQTRMIRNGFGTGIWPPYATVIFTGA